eukprot:gb/GECG01006035.1/.p1 GENE.gb/GECG01006035.1/~~gb/GECG01006035.1/.p1  ORF type:complete len:431 (+),score=44.64 gb/GECG01006035.1/:1-1293(+)
MMSKGGERTQTAPSFIVLDGGTATELETRGKQLDSALWSAEVIETDRDALKNVHKDFFENGADIVITASYQASPEGYKLRGCDYAHFRNMVKASVEIAKQAKLEAEVVPEKQAFGMTKEDRLIAGSVGPFGACLGDGSEYRGNYTTRIGDEGGVEDVLSISSHSISKLNWDRESLSTQDAVCKSPSLEKPSDAALQVEDLMYFHIPRMDALTEASCDLLAIETIPCVKEIAAICALLSRRYARIPAWVSFSCQDGSRLNSGELLSRAIEIVDRLAGNQVVAIGCNCVSPHHVNATLETIGRMECSSKTSSETIETGGNPLCVAALRDVCRRIKNGEFEDCSYKAGTLPSVMYPNVFSRYTRNCVVYPNSGELWDGGSKEWLNDPRNTPSVEDYALYAEQWQKLGGRIIGGCCRTSPRHIRAVSRVASRIG